MIIPEIRDGQSTIRPSVVLRFDVDDDIQDDAENEQNCAAHSDGFFFDQLKTALKRHHSKHIRPLEEEEDGHSSDALDDQNVSHSGNLSMMKRAHDRQITIQES